MKKKIHLEILRLIAIFLVVLTHTGRRGFTYFTTLTPGVGYFLGMLLPLACNICVPLFYMISGATMLGKDEALSAIWKKRIPRYLAVLVLASLGMYVYYGIKNGAALGVGDFLLKLYSRNMIAPYWYLYSYLGFLVLLPFLRKMIRNLTDREFWYLFIVHLAVSGLIPMVQYRLSGGQVALNGSLNLSLVVSTIVIFPAAGYFFEHRRQFGWKQIGLMWLLTVITMAAAMYMTHYKLALTGERAESQVGTFYKSLCLIPTVTVYATVKKRMEGRTVPHGVEKLIVAAGGCTFGTYLIEQILREQGYFICDWLAKFVMQIPATLIYVLLVTVTGMLIVWLAKRIPGVGKLI